MMFGNDKKKKNPAFAIALGALAVYGAYSMVSCVKNTCAEKCKRITDMFKKKGKDKCCEEDCAESDY